MTLRDNELYQNNMILLGNATVLNETTITSCEVFVCTLYSKSRKAGDKVVAIMAFLSEETEQFMATPTPDRFIQHTKHVNYKAYSWKKALPPIQNPPTPEGDCWDTTDGVLRAVWMTKDPAPRGLIEFTVGGYKKSSCQRRKMGFHLLKPASAWPTKTSCYNPNSITQTSTDDDVADGDGDV